jgi:RNA polymerase sigma factor (sigma-70 family)
LPTEIYSIDEATLVRKCIANDAIAQKELYNRFANDMYAICFRYAKNSADAKDMLQEGFIRTFKCINQYQGSGALGAWVRKVMVSCCLNYIKKHNNPNYKLNLTLDNNMHGMEPSYDYKFEEILGQKEIMDCFMQLPIEYRTVLNLYAIEEYSHKEIAQLLNFEEATSRTKVSRARILLKKILMQNKILAVKDL